MRNILHRRKVSDRLSYSPNFLHALKESQKSRLSFENIGFLKAKTLVQHATIISMQRVLNARQIVLKHSRRRRNFIIVMLERQIIRRGMKENVVRGIGEKIWYGIRWVHHQPSTKNWHWLFVDSRRVRYGSLR